MTVATAGGQICWRSSGASGKESGPLSAAREGIRPRQRAGFSEPTNGSWPRRDRVAGGSEGPAGTHVVLVAGSGQPVRITGGGGRRTRDALRTARPCD